MKKFILKLLKRKERKTQELIDTIQRGELFVYEIKLSDIKWLQCKSCNNGGEKGQWVTMESGKVMCVKCGEMN